MRLSLLKSILLLLLILTTTAYCQQQGLSYNFFGGGARSEGMGQAYLALSDDATAGSWNPAGLYVHERTLMAFSYGFLLPRGDYRFNVSPSRTLTYDHSGSINSIDYMALISPLRIKGQHFVFNISYTRHFDTYYKFGEKLFEWSDTNPDDPEDNNDPNAFLERKGGLNSVNFSFGTRLYRNFSIGASANIYTGKIVGTENRFIRGDTVYYGNSIDPVDVVRVAKIDVIDSTSYSGFNMTLGLQYTGDKLHAGMLIRQPFTLKGDSDTTLTLNSTANNVEFGIAGDPQDGIWGNETYYVDNITSQIDIPLMVGVGLAYELKDNFIVAADLEYRGFKGKEVRTLDSLRLTAAGDKEEFYTAFDPRWSNVYQGRIGMEYMLSTSIGEIPLRAGFRNEDFPEGQIRSYDIIFEGEKGPGGVANPTRNDSTRAFYIFNYNRTKVDGWSYSLGTGIHWAQILLDISWTYTMYEQDIYLTSSTLRSKNEWRNHRFNFTFTGYF